MRKLVILLAFLIFLLTADLLRIWLVQQQWLPWQLPTPPAATGAVTTANTATVHTNAAEAPPTNQALAATSAGSGFTIRWGLVNEPPFHIQQGPEQGQGFCDVLVERLQVYLADVRHVTELGSQDNLRYRLYRGDNICLPCSILQPAGHGRLYSKPTHYMQSHGVIVRSTDAPAFRQRFGEPLQLEALLQSDLRFARPAARLYGPLQGMLERFQHKHLLVPATQLQQPSMQMLHWLAQGKTDYALDYISTLHYFSRHDRASLTFIPIAGLTPFLPAASSCPDTNWGQLAILRINAAADQLRRDPRLQQSLRYWFSPELPAYPTEQP